MSVARQKSRTPAPQSAKASIAQQGAPGLVAYAALRGALIGLGASTLLCCLAAAALLSTADPVALITPVALGACSLSALLCGWICQKSARMAPLVCGAAGGALFVLLIAAFGLCLPDNLQSSWPSALAWGLRGGILVFSILGAVLADSAPRKRKKPRRK